MGWDRIGKEVARGGRLSPSDAAAANGRTDRRSDGDESSCVAPTESIGRYRTRSRAERHVPGHYHVCVCRCLFMGIAHRHTGMTT